MILDGFSVAWNFISLDRDGRTYDLHNDYDFRRLSYDVGEQCLRFAWRRRPDPSVSEGLPDELVLVLSGVTRFEAMGRDPDIPFSEDDCLESIGFLANVPGDDLGTAATHVPQEGWDLLFLHFMSGFTVIADAARARLELS